MGLSTFQSMARLTQLFGFSFGPKPFTRAALSAESEDSDCAQEANSDGPSVTAAQADITSDVEDSVKDGKDGVEDGKDGIEDGEVGVKSPECQDPLLAQTYLSLSVLS